jgi:hypothetical protein
MVIYIVIEDHCLSLCAFSFGHFIVCTGLYNGSLEAIYFHFYFENNTSFNKVNMSIFVQIEHFHDYMYLFNCLIGVSNILYKLRVYWTVCTLSTFKVNVLKLKYNQIM